MADHGSWWKEKRSYLIAVLFVLLLVGSNLGVYYLTLQRSALPPPHDEEEYDLAAPESLGQEWNIFVEVLERLQQNYLYPLDMAQVIRGAVKGALEAVDDPRTAFYDEKELENFLIEATGSFGGVGVRIIEVDDEIVVFETLPGSPADSAGIYPGDRISRAGGQKLAGRGVESAAEILRGKKGSKITLSIKRPGREDELSLTLEREEIRMETVFSRWEEPGLAYIRITNFDSHTGESFAAQLSRLEKKGLREGLILDLRDNPGGLVEEAVKVAKLIVPEGEITRLVGRKGAVRDICYSRAPEKEYPIVVLVNEESASAAEILAGALQDRSPAILVGVKTYGKATVQHLENLSGGNALLLTIARYLTPSGRDIDGKGLEPDVTVEMPLPLKYYRYFFPGPLGGGDYGAEVKLLQEMLAELGYRPGSEGYFDRATAAALSKFQKKAGLEATGEFDDLTWVALREDFEKAARERDPQLRRAVELLKQPGRWQQGREKAG